jgi:hypothetical protein
MPKTDIFCSLRFKMAIGGTLLVASPKGEKYQPSEDADDELTSC